MQSAPRVPACGVWTASTAWGCSLCLPPRNTMTGSMQEHQLLRARSPHPQCHVTSYDETRARHQLVTTSSSASLHSGGSRARAPALSTVDALYFWVSRTGESSPSTRYTAATPTTRCCIAHTDANTDMHIDAHTNAVRQCERHPHYMQHTASAAQSQQSHRSTRMAHRQ